MILRIIICLVGLLAVFPLQMQTAAAANGTALGKGWAYYNEGRLDAAAAQFEKAQRSRENKIRMNSALGLSYVRIRQRKLIEGEQILRRLVEKGYRPDETLLRLVEVRISLGWFDDAATAADRLPEPLCREKRQAIAEARIRAAFGTGRITPEAAATFIADHQNELARCQAPELFYRAAGIAEQPKLAVDTYQLLLQCPLSPELRHGVLENLAWNLYKRGEIENAERLFLQLQAEKPDSLGAALGIAYSRLNTGRAETALDPITAAGFSNEPEVLELKKLVYTRLGWNRYNALQLEEAGSFADRALSIAPQDRDARLLRAWIDIRQGNHDLALATFQDIYSVEQSPEAANQLLDAQVSAGHLAAAQATAEELAATDNPAMRTRAADFFFNHYQPIRAARTAGVSQRCYLNADTSILRLDSYFRYRDGDDGTSRLTEYALPIEFETVLGAGTRAFMGLTPKRLKSGNGPNPPPVGNFYRYLDGIAQSNDLIEDESVMIPQIGFKTEGPLSWSGRIATTPIGGEVTSTVIGEITVGTDSWHVNLHRNSVTDSILSTTGLRDPYGDGSWGRVVASGVSVGGVLPLNNTYWLSATAGGDLYDGFHVWDNTRFTVDLSSGGTWRVFDGDELSTGLFLYAENFSRNSNYFTYGHGGYYSPKLMTMTGPFVRYRSDCCRLYWFDIQASVGWLHQETEDAPRYPLLDDGAPTLSAAAQADANGTFEGETSDELGHALRVEGWRLFSDHLALGGFAGTENSSDHSEWMAGLGLRWYFKPQNALWQRWDSFKRLGDGSNR